MKYLYLVLITSLAVVSTHAKPALSRRIVHEPAAISESNIPSAKVRPSAYSGTLKPAKSVFLFRPNYDYCITDKKDNTIAFIDTTELVTGTPLLNLKGKEITVTGQSFPHKYRGVIVIKAQSIIINSTQS